MNESNSELLIQVIKWYIQGKLFIRNSVIGNSKYNELDWFTENDDL